jgi:plastocyanin
MKRDLLALLVVIAAPVAPVAADHVHATAGAQSRDKSRQALAFLPNELWVHVGDSVTWAFPTDEVHTVSFLRTSPTPQIRPRARDGCPGTTHDGSDYLGATNCLTSGELAGGATYTVRFPTAGNFKLVCLIHANMTGVVHVLDVTRPLPFDQTFYDRQAEHERAELLSDGSRLEGSRDG